MRFIYLKKKSYFLYLHWLVNNQKGTNKSATKQQFPLEISLLQETMYYATLAMPTFWKTQSKEHPGITPIIFL